MVFTEVCKLLWKIETLTHNIQTASSTVKHLLKVDNIPITLSLAKIGE